MAVGEGNVLQVARGVADGADALEDRLRVIVEERVDERQFAAVLEQVRVRAPALLLTDAMHTSAIRITRHCTSRSRPRTPEGFCQGSALCSRRIERMLLEGDQLEAPAAPLSDLLRIGLEAAPDEVAITSAHRALSWHELERASAALAGGYRGLGLEPGDRLASLMPNRVDLVVHYLACFRAGLIATPLNYRYTAREIDHALEVSGARAPRPCRARRGRRRQRACRRPGAWTDRLPRCRTAGDRQRGAGRGRRRLAPRLRPASGPEPLAGTEREPEHEAPALILFTSGSTGPAKGVTHSRETLRWMIGAAAAAFELDASDVLLPGSSMSHIGSFLWTLSTLSVGGQVVVARSTDGHELLPLLREQQPTILAMIPAALSALVHDHGLRPGDSSSLRLCRAGADKVSTELLTEFAATAGFPIVEGYGMTEVGLATMNPPSGDISKARSGGRSTASPSRCEMKRAPRSRAEKWARSGSAAGPACSATGARPARPRRW